MAFFPDSLVRRNVVGVAQTTFNTQTAGYVLAAAAVSANLIDKGLVARVYASAKTNTLTLSAKWQGLDWADGTTWLDIVDPQNPSNVVLVTGTGAQVQVTKYIGAPQCSLGGIRQVRCVIFTGVATSADALDLGSISYGFRAPWF